MGPYSRENLRDNKDYQEIILINGLDKKIERRVKEKNERTRLRLRVHGYFYNVEDKNIYINEIAVHIGGAGIRARVLRHYNSLKYKKKFETAAKNKDWLSIYRHTKFLINSTYGKAWFSFQFLPKDPQYLARPFAIVSAENPSMQVQSDTLNEINNNEIKEVLSSLHYEFYPSCGELSGHVEKSYIIYDISEEKAIELGQKFQQESILFNDGNSIQILNCSDKKPVLQFEHKKVYPHETDPDAQFDLAYKLATGDGIEQDIPKAIDLYEPLAQEKDLVAMHNVALLYCKHYGDDPEKLARGIQYFKYAANHDYDPSNCEMMKLHLIGFGVEKNHKMAVGYLLRALDNGYEKCGKEYYRLIISLKDFGESITDRILIVEESNGVEVEYQILSRLLGERNKDWFLKQQRLINENGIQVDKMDIELLSGETKSYYFDITRSFGKFDIDHTIRNKNSHQLKKNKSMNTGEQTVEWLYREQLRIDEKWSVRTPNGFRWWADKHAQTIEVVGQEVSPDGLVAYIISVRTELLQSVDLNEKNLKHINSMLMPFVSMSGPFYDHNNKRLDLCSLVRVHDEISEWMNPLISMAAILQIGEARIMGESLAEALNAEEAVSGHPDHGIRPEPDELVEAIASLIAPMGAEPSRWKAWEFQDMDKFMNQFPSIVGTVGDMGFTVEFPYGDETSLCQVKNNEPHPRYGNGLFILQSFPLGDISEMKGIDLALLMNEIELTQEPLGYGLGSYVYDKGMLHFTAFFPNALYRQGMLANIFFSCAERANEMSIRGSTHEDLP